MRSDVVHNFGSVCMSVCLSVCQTITFESLDRRICTCSISPCSTGWVRMWRSPGQGQGHRSQKRRRFLLPQCKTSIGNNSRSIKHRTGRTEERELNPILCRFRVIYIIKIEMSVCLTATPCVSYHADDRASELWTARQASPSPQAVSGLLVKFRCRRACAYIFNSLVWGEPLNSGSRKLASRKYKHRSIVVDIFTDDYFVLSGCTCLTDRRTDRCRQQDCAHAFAVA